MATPLGNCNVRHLILLTLTALAIFAGVSRAQDEESTSGVTLTSTRLTIEQGTTSTATCELTEDITGTLTWLDPSGLPASSDNQSRIYMDAATGVLSLSGLYENDTGDYICVLNYTGGFGDPDATTGDPSTTAGGETPELGCFGDGVICNATLALKVYTMPSYATDGIIVLVINLVLGAIFIISLIYSAIVDRRRLRKYGQKL